MSMSTVASAAEALKKFYLSAFRTQLNEQADPLFAQLRRDTESVSGDEIVMPLRYGRSGGVAFGADDRDLPTPQARQAKQAKWKVKNLFARMSLTDRLIKASRDDRGAFARMLELEMEELLTDAKDTVSRSVYGDGSGILTKCKANTAATTLEVDSVAYLDIGMIVDFIDTATGDPETGGTARVITGVDESSNKITISGSGITTDTDTAIVLNGSYGQELTGLDAVFATDNTIYGIDRTTNQWFNVTKKQLSSGSGDPNLTETDIQFGIDEAERKVGARINFIITSYGVRRAYQALLETQKRIVNTLNLKGGFEALAYVGGQGAIPIVAGKYAPPGIMRLLDLRSWALYQMSDFDWLDMDGARLSRVANKAAYEATLVMYADIGCDKPRGQTEISNIVELN